jgi:hypothetical protein
MRSEAIVVTNKASTYLQQLCKHWSHRFAVTYDPVSGHVDFGNSQIVEFSAAVDVLRISISDDDAKRLDELEAVVADHLRRFAFRETLAIDWTRS